MSDETLNNEVRDRKETTRISIEIPTVVNDHLNKLMPWGMKANVFRNMIELLILAHNDDKNIVSELLNHNCKLTVQSLNTPLSKEAKAL